MRRVIHAGTTLANAVAVIYTFGDGLTSGGAIIKKLTICNQTNAARIATIYFTPSGVAAGVPYVIYHGTVAADSSVSWDGPWHMDSGAVLRGELDADADVSLRATMAEEPLNV